MSAEPSTYLSRNLTVNRTTAIHRMLIKGRAFVILNPTLCEPDRKYRVDLDPETCTAVIREVTS